MDLIDRPTPRGPQFHVCVVCDAPKPPNGEAICTPCHNKGIHYVPRERQPARWYRHEALMDGDAGGVHGTD